MKLKNTTDFPNWFLRRLISWGQKQIGLKPKILQHALFTKWSRSFRGTAYLRAIIVRIGGPDRFPTRAYRYGGYDSPGYSDCIEALVAITVHELTHVLLYHNKVQRRDREYQCEWHSHQALKVFQENRQALLSQWSKEPARVAAKKSPESIVDKRAKKAVVDLARWIRKLTLAKTKVRKLKLRVAYYQKGKTNE